MRRYLGLIIMALSVCTFSSSNAYAGKKDKKKKSPDDIVISAPHQPSQSSLASSPLARTGITQSQMPVIPPIILPVREADASNSLSPKSASSGSGSSRSDNAASGNNSARSIDGSKPLTPRRLAERASGAAHSVGNFLGRFARRGSDASDTPPLTSSSSSQPQQAPALERSTSVYVSPNQEAIQERDTLQRSQSSRHVLPKSSSSFRSVESLVEEPEPKTKPLHASTFTRRAVQQENLTPPPQPEKIVFSEYVDASNVPSYASFLLAYELTQRVYPHASFDDLRNIALSSSYRLQQNMLAGAVMTSSQSDESFDLPRVHSVPLNNDRGLGTFHYGCEMNSAGRHLSQAAMLPIGASSFSDPRLPLPAPHGT